MTTEPEKFNPEETPGVKLAGKVWPIPHLVPRQQRMIRRQIIDLTDAIAPTVDPENPEGPAKVTAGEKVLKLTNEQYGWMQDVVFYGLTRAHPDLDRNEFLDMEVNDMDLYVAFLVVRRQSGIYTLTTAPAKDAPAGEAPADGQTQTGT